MMLRVRPIAIATWMLSTGLLLCPQATANGPDDGASGVAPAQNVNPSPRGGCGPTLTLRVLNPQDVCARPGEQLTVTLSMSCLTSPTYGFQAFVAFDPSFLTFNSGAYTPTPFGLSVISPITANGPNIDMAAGIDGSAGQTPTTSDANLAHLTFTAGSNEGQTTVMFRGAFPPSRLSGADGQPIPATLVPVTLTVDATAPVMTCPDDITVRCDGETDPGATGSPSVSDNLDPSPMVTFSDQTSGTCPRTITRTWTVTDACGNSTSCVQTISLVPDLVPPVITCPPDVSIPCGSSTHPSNTGAATAVDDVDPTPTVTFSDSVDGVCPKTITRTWTAADDVGNASTCTQVIVVEGESTPPEIFCPADLAIPCEDSIDPSNTGMAMATDNCDMAPEIAYSDEFSGVCPTRVTRTWTATDFCGNSSSCVQVITQVGICESPPTLTLSVHESLDLCVQPGDTITVQLSMFCIPVPVRGYQAFLEFDTNSLMFNSGSYIPGPFNRMIISPITANGGNINLAAGIDDVSGQPPAMDNADLAILHFTVLSAEGPTTVRFRSSDPPSRFSDVDGQPINPALVNTPAIVVDSTSPMITCPGTVSRPNAPGECGTLVNTGMATATDPGGSGVVSVVGMRDDGLDLSSSFPVGDTIITWTATDCAGNSSSCMQTITVFDHELPTITCPANISGLSVGSGQCQRTLIIPPPVVDDNCAVGSVVNDYTGTSDASGVYFVGTTTIIWTVTDIYGNMRQCTQTVTITDSVAPTITCPPNLMDVNDPGVCLAAVVVPAPSAADNCGVNTVTNNRNGTDDAGGDYPVGVTTVTWTATDASGNTAQCSHQVTIVDNEPPTIACPGNIARSTDPGMCQATVTVPIPMTLDNCGVAGIVNDRTGTANASGTYPVGTTTLTWTVTDIHGNTNQCSHTVTVTDDEDPMITCPPDIVANADPGTSSTFVSVPSPVVSDNCGVAGVVNDRTGTADASGVYTVGTVTITWTVTDIYGHTAQCSHTVTVQGMNEMVVDVELSPAVAPMFTRCITFELYECGTGAHATAEGELTFINGLASGAVVLIPTGTYDCVTARDRLHTLRRTDDNLMVLGTQYHADFTGNPVVGGDWLVGGNLNDDEFIDILDFGVFINQFAASYGGGNTTCATPFPHADVSGNGTVTLADFTFIQINFLKVSEANCCGLPGRSTATSPLAEIAVEELRVRGMGHLAIADLNRDGRLDPTDIMEFAAGAIPDVNGHSQPSEAQPIQTDDRPVGLQPRNRDGH